jgi:hypothetical protein
MKLVLTLAALCLITAAPLRAEMLATDPHVYPVTKSHRVHIEFPVGELRVLPSDEANVRFELRVKCNGRSTERCEEFANRLVLDSENNNGELRLKLHKYPKWGSHVPTVMGELHVPRALSLEVEMGVGELDVDGIEGDLEVDLGVGEAKVRSVKLRSGSVSVQAGVGEATIEGGGIRTSGRGFIGSSRSWTGGPGRSSVRLHVGVGEASVKLD